MDEIKPPWIEYPDYPPYDTFWRQSGEIYLKYIWEPFWKKLSSEQQTEYLKKWPAPKKWQDFYFDEKFHAMLAQLDKE